VQHDAVEGAHTMTLLHQLRRLAQRTGLDVSRYPQESPDYWAFRAFCSTMPDVVLDVGANDGGYARQCRRFGYKGEIVSFEPGSAAFARLERAAAADRHWTVHRMGLGASAGELILHVAGNAGASSSLLPMLPAHEEAAPEACFVAKESVPVRRLDEWIATQPAAWKRLAIKVDTQGFERQVLEGAGRLLDERITSLQLELSLVPLYEGGCLWEEIVDWLKLRGYCLAGITPGFSDPWTGRLLQFDGVFLRPADCSVSLSE
jgi:FkbM family methyltransferase